MLIWFLQEYFEIQNWMNGKDYSLLSLWNFSRANPLWLRKEESDFLEILNWQLEYKICKQGILYSNALSALPVITKFLSAHWNCLFKNKCGRRRADGGRFFFSSTFGSYLLSLRSHETTKSIEFLQTWYHDVLLWLLCFLMINILVILLTIDIYWLLLVEY